jgi:hypothetical protein
LPISTIPLLRFRFQVIDSGFESTCRKNCQENPSGFVLMASKSSMVYRLLQLSNQMADGLGSPRMVGHLLISWDSLGQRIIRVAQNDRYRNTTLSEIRRKNLHSVPVWWMEMKSD